MADLPLLDDSHIDRVLCIVAHPDDMEYGASAAVAKWTGQGKTVAYLLLTRGEAGIRSMPPDQVAPLRAEEQARACSIVGVDDLEILEFPDGMLEVSQELRRAIAKKLREFRPDAVMVTNWNLETAWGLNHVDHRAAGIATVDAIRDADNPWLFTDLADSGLEAWKASQLLVTGPDSPTDAIELSAEDVAKGVESLEAHTVYLEALGDHPEPKDMITDICANTGAQAGVEYALPVRVYEM
ncbi:PIG-L deacetylase family protein [Brevibacterium sp. W7.2]|uniref:PIG-L deacetylase family protein n=1 Tax=Brevibacterium sp. W7.2 TaxID=2823518 RepID=UPI001BAC0B78|nr:PIG-L deacetylase family protein [Brevibacterium sp. W7.2]